MGSAPCRVPGIRQQANSHCAGSPPRGAGGRATRPTLGRIVLQPHTHTWVCTRAQGPVYTLAEARTQNENGDKTHDGEYISC